MELTKPKTDHGNIQYATTFAQKIIDHFGATLQGNNCMLTVPMGVYLELDRYEKQIIDYSQAIIDADNPMPKKDPLIEDNEEYDFGLGEIKQYIYAAAKNSGNDCFDCKIEMPKFDFSGLFANLIFEVEAFLDQLKNIFKYNKADMCQYGFMLSYMCIPDLLKLIAMILAAIVRILSKITLPRITLTFFIMGILSAIINVLLRNIAILARFALTPVLCLLDAIDSIIDALPLPENLRAVSGQDLEELGADGIMSGKYDTNLKATSQKVRAAYTNKIRDTEGKMQKMTQDTFGGLEKVVQKSIDSLNESINELTGLFRYFQCENSRSGLSIGEHLSALSELMALANLIRHVISGKGKRALDEVCNKPRDSMLYDFLIGKNNPLSIEDIGSAIGNTLNTDITIVTDDNKPIYFLIKKTDNNPWNPDGDTKNLTFWNCNLNDFLNNSTLHKVLELEFKNNIDQFSIGDFHLNDITIKTVPRASADLTDFNYDVIPLNIDENWHINDHVKSIFDTIEKYSPSKEGTKEIEVKLFPDDISPENVFDALTDGLEQYSPNIRRYILGANTTDEDVLSHIQKEKDPNKDIQDKTKDISSLSGRISDTEFKQHNNMTGIGQRIINLQCGTVEDIADKLGLLNDE